MFPFRLFFFFNLKQKSRLKGFTLIELLIVVVIMGILAAIALPSFLNQANKAKQAEAKTYIGSMNRAQQAYYLEKAKFVSQEAFDQLGLGLNPQTINYTYSIATDSSDLSYVVNIARPRPASLKAYLGPVKLGTATHTGEATTLTTICEALKTPIETGHLPATNGSNITFSNFGLGQVGEITCDSSIYTDIGE